VLQEIWAGARSSEERRYVERVHALAHRYHRIPNPPAAAWILSGQTLGVLGRRGAVGPSRLRALRNDVLLAATAFVHRATVVTRNVGDFRLVAAVLPVRFMAPPGSGEG
jgi:predicted nucleic acid-binding protein